jgi:hypothetical protein
MGREPARSGRSSGFTPFVGPRLRAAAGPNPGFEPEATLVVVI